MSRFPIPPSELACDLDESSYVVPNSNLKISIGNSYLDLGDLNIDDDSDDEISPHQKEREGNELHDSREKIERMNEFLENHFNYKNILDENICAHCGNAMLKCADNLILATQSKYHKFNYEAHRLQAKMQQVSQSTDHTNTIDLNQMLQAIKSLEEEIEQIESLNKDSVSDKIALTTAIAKEHEMLNDIEYSSRKLEDGLLRDTYLAEQSFSELGYLSSLRTIHAKPLFNIAVAHHPMPATKSSPQHMTPQPHRIFAINGFRLNFEPVSEYHLSWTEINAAWATVAALLLCLRNRGGFDRDVRNTSNSLQALSTREHLSVYGIRVVALRARALIALLGSLNDDASTSVLVTLPLEGFASQAVSGRVVDIMSSSFKAYRKSVLSMCLFIAFTVVELHGSTARLVEPLLSLYLTSLDGKTDFSLEGEDDWDDSIPRGGMLEGYEGNLSSSYHFNDFEGLTSAQFHALVNAAILVLTELI
jgi:Pyruvate/2-oxoacid:ferredoxin oxidoreductase delta subunit